MYANTRKRVLAEWGPTFEVLVGLFMILVEFFQLSAFVFSIGIPWWSKHPALKIAAPFQLNFGFMDELQPFLPLFGANNRFVLILKVYSCGCRNFLIYCSVLVRSFPR